MWCFGDRQRSSANGSASHDLEREGGDASVEPKLHAHSIGKGKDMDRTNTVDSGETLGKRKPETSITSSSTMTHLKWFFGVPDMSWIKDNLTLTRMKPAIRCAIAAWISGLLVVVPGSEKFLGESGFIIMIASFLAPPAEPFVGVLKQEMIVQIATVGGFAWSCLGIKLANLARSKFVPDALESDVFAGKFIETGPSLICATFLCIGTSVLLYMRAVLGTGKPLFEAFVLAFTALDSSLTMAALYPYPNYSAGRDVVIPVAWHSLIAILASLIIFPDTIHDQFRGCFRAVSKPLTRALRSQPGLLLTSPSSPSFDPEACSSMVWEAECALVPLAVTRQLMKKDFSYGRFGARDFEELQDLARQLTIRANGMAFYFKIMDFARHKLYTAPYASSMRGTPDLSRCPSPPLSIPASTTPVGHKARQPSTSSGTTTPRRTFQPSNIFQYPLLSSAASLYGGRPSENAVGLFESQRFLRLESRVFTQPDADAMLARMMSLLADSASELLVCCADTLEYVDGWLNDVPTLGILEWFSSEKKGSTWAERITENQHVKEKLLMVFAEFRDVKRHHVLDPYRNSTDPNKLTAPSDDVPPPHRYLFQCYSYQYHLIIFASRLVRMLDEIDKLERTRQRRRLWVPSLPLSTFFSCTSWEPSISAAQDEDEDPDTVLGIDPNSRYALEKPSPRNPDALPPANVLESLGSLVYGLFNALRQGNVQFALKGFLLASVLCLPAFLRDSAAFAITNRYVWAIVVGQATLSRFRGDTTFGLVARVLSTLFGGVVGMIMWYISTGSGSGNAWGLAAVTAVCYPAFSFARIYYAGPQLRIAFFLLTSQLVIGYSWYDSHFPSAQAAGWGFNVAWRRFLFVCIGVMFPYISSFLPPTRTLRRHLRTTYATTVDRIGQLYCEVVSHAMVYDESRTAEIARNLGAIRMKLKRSKVLCTNVAYEYSMRGKWPAERYKKVLDLQMEIAYLLSHLRSVTDHLDPEWSRALLRRTRFLESDVQGDVLAVICMISTALRTGTPLPQITPSPLLDRFILHHPGQSVLRGEPDDDQGLPQSLTIETLENEQYLYFSVGVITAFGIVMRLDSLMLATKELVGEQYHIRGLTLSEPFAKGREQEFYPV